MNFPTSQSLHCLACSPTRSRGSPLPEGAFWGVRTLQKFPAGANIGRPLSRQKQNSVGEGFPLPLVWSFISPTGGAPLSLPCVRGGAALPRGGGVVPDTNYLLFLFCKLHTFTIPQALSRQLPLHKGAFGIVRTLRECTLLLARANIGRPLSRQKQNSVGEGFPLPLVWNFISPTGGAPLSLPCVRGGAALPRGGGVVPDKNYLSFLLCKLHTFTIPQALSRQLPLLGGAFGIVRTLRECTLLLARATVGRLLSQ